MRRLILGLIFISFLMSISGCKTVKNTAMGLGAVGKGMVDDVYDTWQAMERADVWIKENLW